MVQPALVLQAKTGMALAVGLLAQRAQAKFGIVQVKVVFAHLVRVCRPPLVGRVLSFPPAVCSLPTIVQAVGPQFVAEVVAVQNGSRNGVLKEIVVLGVFVWG